MYIANCLWPMACYFWAGLHPKDISAVSTHFTWDGAAEQRQHHAHLIGQSLISKLYQTCIKNVPQMYSHVPQMYWKCKYMYIYICIYICIYYYMRVSSRIKPWLEYQILFHLSEGSSGRPCFRLNSDKGSRTC